MASSALGRIGCLLIGALLVGCMSDDGSTDEAHRSSGPHVDRTVADRALYAIAEDRLKGRDLIDQVPLVPGDCPVLAEVSIAELVEKSGSGLELRGARSEGFLALRDGGLDVSCSAGAGDEVSVRISVSQQNALNPDEWLAGAQRFEVDEDLAIRIEDVDGFRPRSTLAFVVDERTSYAWLESGIMVEVAMAVTGEDAAPDALTALLRATRDSVLRTLDAGRPEPLEHDLPERRQFIAALTRVMPEGEGPQLRRFDNMPCPVLDEAAYGTVARQLGWDADTDAQGQASPGHPGIYCDYGSDEDGVGRTLSVGHVRALTVDEEQRYAAGPLNRSTFRTASYDTEVPLLRGRSYVEDGAYSRRAGWIRNGLSIIVSLQPDQEPEDVLAVVVPAVLDTLDLEQP